MDDIKKAWVSYFISLRDSRRKDMRHYTGMSVAVISIVLFIATTTLNGSLFPRIRTEQTPRGEVVPAAVGVVEDWVFTPSLLGFSRGGLLILASVTVSVVLFCYWVINQHRIAEKEIKDYDDAIDVDTHEHFADERGLPISLHSAQTQKMG